MNQKARQLLHQFVKFSIVGIIAFFIDYGLFLLLDYVFSVNYLIASTISFIVATVFNFFASMRYVFEGRKDHTRTKQFVIFFTLSVIGLGLNQLFLWICVAFFKMYAWLGKLVATVLVTIFNFITRKVFLEEHH